MRAYAFWNNKGGVGKSFLAFIAASEFAHSHPEIDVYVIDLCPQANLTETLLGGQERGSGQLKDLLHKLPRGTIAGYLEARLNSPFEMIDEVSRFVTSPSESNSHIPENLMLIAGDNLLEVISEAMRQTAQLSIPTTAWQQVLSWVADLRTALAKRSGERDSLFIVDCNPSFAIYTQMALVAANRLVIPFTADDSSRRGIENVVALLYGIGDPHTQTYARISFAKRAKEEGIHLPTLHSFISNRVTMYEREPSRAFKAAAKAIENTMDDFYRKHRLLFSESNHLPSESFINIPDYHSACVVAALTGTPLHKLKPGPKVVAGERIQLNKDPLDRYKKALTKFVESL